MTYRFPDRAAAGRLLAGQLRRYAHRQDVLVLALPRGGVPVAFEIAQALDAPLDVMVVRKLGVPGYEELALGAVAPGGMRVINEEIVRELAIPAARIEAIAARQHAELVRRERIYRGERPPAEIAGRTVILVDDGLATGSTMHAAVAAVRQHSPARIAVAVPVVALESCEAFQAAVDEIVWLLAPEPFDSVGMWYQDFRPTTDEEVRMLLGRQHAHDARQLQPSSA